MRALVLLILVAAVPLAASASPSLIPNGGFELDADLDGTPDNWTGERASIVALRSPLDPRAESHSLAALVPLAPGIVRSDPFPIPSGGATLRASADVEADQAVSLKIEMMTEQGAVLATRSARVPVMGAWSSVGVEITPGPLATHARVSFVSAPGTLRADNVAVGLA